MLKSRLLSSTAVYAAPNDEGGTPEDERLPEITLDDDETVTDPVETPEDADADDTTDAADDETDAGDDADAEPVAAAERPLSRGERRIAALNERTRQLAEDNARITRQLEEMRRAPAATQQPVESAQQRADRFALMSPEERIREEVSEALKRNEFQTQQLTNQLLDQGDKASFEALAARSPLVSKLAPEVERRLAEIRHQGQNCPRDTVLKYVLGERLLAQQGKAKPAAAARRRAQEARPVRSGGDVAVDRSARRSGGSVADLEARFGDVPI